MSNNFNFKEFFNHYETNSTSDDIQRYYLLWKSVIAQAMTDAASIAFLIIVRTGHRKAESTARRKDSNRGMFFLALFFIANQ